MPSSEKRTPPAPFGGFRSPNYTPVPDELFDELLVDLSGAELKALLYIIRRTFGFKRDSDNISLSQMLQGIRTRDGRVLDRGVGLSKKTLLLSLRSLEERGIILTERRQSVEKGNEPTTYRLNVLSHVPDPPLGEETTPPLGEKLHQGGGGESTPSPWGKNYTTQETVKQQTVLQETVEQKTEIDSNDFERVANLQNRIDSEISKKRDRNFWLNDGGEGPPAARPENDRRSFIRVDQLLEQRQVRPSRKSASDSPKTAARTAAVADPDAYSVSRSSAPSRGTRGRPPRATEQIEAVLEQISGEFHDEEHLRSNVGQAARLWRASGLSEADFVGRLYEARSITKDRGTTIQKPATGEAGEWGMRNRMPYFFAVVRDLLGMKGGEAP